MSQQRSSLNERSYLELVTVYEICRILGASLDIARTFRAALNVLTNHLDLPRAMIVLPSGEEGEAQLRIHTAAGLERVADVPIYSTDMLVRRSPPLQQTADARPPVVSLPSALWAQLGLQPGARVLVAQGQGAVLMPAREDASLAPSAVRVAAGHAATLALGPMFGPITVEKA